MMHLASGTEPSAQFRQSSGAHTDVAEVARRAEVGALVLTHFTPLIDVPGTRERLIAEMAADLSRPDHLGRGPDDAVGAARLALRHRLDHAWAAATETDVSARCVDVSSGAAAAAGADRHRGRVAARLRARRQSLLSQHARRGVPRRSRRWIADGTLWPHLGATLATTLFGFVIAAAVAIPLALIVSARPFLDGCSARSSSPHIRCRRSCSRRR